MINIRFKKFALIAGYGLLSFAVQAQKSIAINNSGASGNAATILDMSANPNLGFLLPRVSLSSYTDATTIPSAPNGTMVYNTNASMPGGVGIYYWAAGATPPQWYYLLSSGFSAGVTSITGTSPVNVAPTSGTPVISLQGTNGGIYYGTGGGSAVTAGGGEGSILYNSSANTPGWLPLGNSGSILSSDGSIPTWLYLTNLGADTAVNATAPITANLSGGVLSLGLTTPLAVQYGGTGLTSVPANAIIYGNGTGAVNTATAPNNGVLISNVSSIPSWLNAGNTGNVLYVNRAGTPQWANPDTLILVNNGLANSSGTIQLGGPLVQNTIINASGSNYGMAYDLGTGSAAGTGTFSVTNGGNGNPALLVKNSGNSRNGGQIGIDTTAPAASAVLDINSTTGGVLIPRMTSLQQAAISSPATGLTIYNTTTNCYMFYGGIATGWETIACSCSGAPSAPSFSGSTPTSVCGGISSVYAVAASAGATGYNWTAPTGGAVIAGQNSSTATILMPPVTTATPATITVVAYNSCGTSAATALAVTVNPSPATPALLNGFTAVCNGQSGVIYSVEGIPGNSYTWTLPSGFTGSSLSDSISANIAITSTTVAVLDTIKVSAINSASGCPSPSYSSLVVTVNPTPSVPITPVQTPTTTICQGSTGITYSVTPVTGASSYTWLVPSGFTIIGSSSGNSITVNVSNTAVSGDVSVVANNSTGPCSSAGSSPLAVTLGPPSVPSQPVQSPSGGICIGHSYQYSVTAVPGASNYIWTFPAGSIATSNPATTSSPSVTVTYTNFPNCGNVTCQAENSSVSGCTSATSPPYIVSVSNTCDTMFSYTGSNQAWNVPCGITQITVKLWGAGGGSVCRIGGGSGGGGAFVSGTLPVAQGATLYMVVGEGGYHGVSTYGGGGAGTIGVAANDTGGGGGGRTAIQYPLNNDLVTAGGGGGSGFPDGTGFHCNGGGGGGSPNANGKGDSGSYSSTAEYGGGGLSDAGGTAYCPSQMCGAPGNQYTGGVAGPPDVSGGAAYLGGGGGGGYYGGGGGGTYIGAGGGGGSSYTHNLLSGFTNTVGWTMHTGGLTGTNTAGTLNSGTGIACPPGGATDPNYPGSPIGYGAASATVLGQGKFGGNGYIYIIY